MLYSPAHSWPLNLVLDSKSMEDYSALWRMLMQLHRILDAVRQLWSVLKDMTRVHGNFTVGQINSLSLIRHEMQRFIKRVGLEKFHCIFIELVLHINFPKSKCSVQTTGERAVDLAVGRCRCPSPESKAGDWLAVCATERHARFARKSSCATLSRIEVGVRGAQACSQKCTVRCHSH